MRYLSATEEPNLPKPMADTKTLVSMLKTMGDLYQPSQKFSLTMKQLRSLNRALDCLDGEPEDGYYVLDNEEFEVLRALVEQYAPAVLVAARNAPVILDALLASPEKRPEKPKQPAEQTQSENGVVKEKVTQEA